MKTQLLPLLLLAGALSASGAPLVQGTAFTYQGQLNTGSAPANGLYEMSFTLFDTPTNGNVVGTPVTVAPLPVTNGLFTATLDFGADAFTGASRWLEIAVTVFDSNQPVLTLIPRQPITSTPYALHAANAAGLMGLANAPVDINVNGQRVLRLDASLGSAPNVIGGAFVNGVAPGVLGATIGGGGTSSPGFEATNRVEANYGTISGGLNNSIGNGSRESTVSGGGGNRIDADSGWSTIGGGEVNRIDLNARYSTIAGGELNTARSYGSVIGGGSLNAVQPNADHSAIGGGLRNSIATNAAFSTIAGGNANLATVWGATVGGGGSNQASSYYAVVSGGTFNQSTGDYAAVPGGLRNQASGPYSFAAGRQANALHLGAFVWSDASGQETARPYTFDSATTNEFAVRATGGVRFVSAIDTTGSNIAGITLAPGSGSWSSLSDRNVKENFAAANAREILDQVTALPLASWNYKAQGAGVRHLGPMAQDFHAAFGLGESERTIATVDADGVALAAIQGLNEKVEGRSQQTEGRIRKLEAENAELKARLERLEQLLAPTTAK